jgi:FAD/FMN-containing dehydrogenase
MTIEVAKQQFTGDIILPDNTLYEEASAVFMRKGKPTVIFRPKNAEDVGLAIAYAQENNLVLSVRSGGHSGVGFSTNDDGVVVDLMYLDTVELLDEAKALVRIGAGAKWGHVAKTLGQHNLALSSGDTASVGVGGLTLGGGVGWMVRKFGLAIDSVVAAEIITANGQILRVSEQEHADLFWAIRGGSGNFGIVTYFEFKAHQVREVFAGTIMYKRDNVGALLRGWRDAMRDAPDELTTMFLIMPSFGDQPATAMTVVCYAGDDETAAKQAIEPLASIGEVISKDIAQKTYAEVLEEAHPPEGMKIIVNDIFIQDFSDAAIDTMAAQEGTVLQLRYLGGAMNRVPKDATAFAHRDSEILVVAPTFTSPTATDEEIAKLLEPWSRIATFGNGSYCNFLTSSDAASIQASFPGSTYTRLVEIKHTYDPENFFNQTYNITPDSQ